MSFFNYKVLDGYLLNNGDGYSFSSPWTDVKQALAYSISLQFTGTPNGTVVLQASNESSVADPWGNITGTTSAQGVNGLNGQPQFNGLDATNITGASANVSSAGTVFFDISLPGHRWVRAVYTSTSGNATVNMWLNAKIP